MADINEIISKAGIDSVKQTTAELEKANLALQDTIVGAKKLSEALAGTKSMPSFTKGAEASAKAQADLNKTLAQTQQIEARTEVLRASNYSKEEARQKKEAQSAANNSKKITEQSRLYTQLSARLEVLRKNAQDIGVQFGVNSSQFEKASASVVKLDASLKEVDRALGKSTRYVGEYERAGARGGSSFNALSNSINQMSRELPAFTFSVQTGFLALSNNIPIFADALGQVTERTKALRAEGQKVPSVFSQLVSSVFSWGTALSVGITLLTVYGKEVGVFVASLFKGSVALDEFAERQRMIGEALKSSDYTSAVKNVQELSINIKLAKEGLIDKKAVLNQYNTTLGKTTGEVQTLDEAEKALVRNGPAYIEMTLKKAVAQLALDEAAKKTYEAEISRRKRLEEFGNEFLDASVSNVRSEAQYRSQQRTIIENRKRRQKEEVKISEDAKNQQLKIAADFQKEAAIISKKFGFNLLDEPKEGNKKKTRNVESRNVESEALEALIILEKIQKDYDETLLNNEKLSNTERLEALNSYNTHALRIAELGHKKEVILNKEAKKDINAINTAYGKELLDINADVAIKSEKILADELKRTEDLRVNSNKKAINLLNIKRDQELLSLNEAGLSQEEYEKKNLEITNKYDLEEVKLAIAQAEKLLEIRSLQGADITDEEAKLASLKLKLSSLTFDQAKKDNDKIVKLEKEKFENIKELAQEAFEFIGSLTKGVFDGNINMLEKESQATEEKKNKDIEAVNESLLSEEQKQERVAIIESQNEERQKQIDARISAQKRKQAVADKAFALAQIAINTAMAMTKVSAQTGILTFAFSPLIAAFGAIQAATVLATPIPEFRHGGTMKHDGIAQFGEEGRELRVNPDGTTELTPSTTTLGFVQKGTKFYTASDTKKMMAKSNKVDIGGNSFDISGLISESKRSTSDLKKSINKLSAPSTIITKQGWHNQSVKQGQFKQYLNRNLG